MPNILYRLLESILYMPSEGSEFPTSRRCLQVGYHPHGGARDLPLLRFILKAMVSFHLATCIVENTVSYPENNFVVSSPLYTFPFIQTRSMGPIIVYTGRLPDAIFCHSTMLSSMLGPKPFCLKVLGYLPLFWCRPYTQGVQEFNRPILLVNGQQTDN